MTLIILSSPTLSSCFSYLDVLCKRHGPEISLEQIRIEPGGQEVKVGKGGGHADDLDTAVGLPKKLRRQS